MAADNVELVRAGFDAFNRRDFDAALDLFDDSATWRPVFTLEGPLLEGKDAIRKWWTGQVETLDIHVDPVQFIPVGESTVVAVATWTGAGRMSGTPIETTRALVFTIESGKAIRVESFTTAAEALEAVSADPRAEGWALYSDGRLDTERLLVVLSDDVVWDLSRSSFPDAGVYHGIDGVRDWYRGLDDAFGDVRYDVEQVRAVGEQLAVLLHVHGRGPGSQIAVDYHFVPVFTFRSGKIVRMDRYDDWATATRAIGLADAGSK